MRIPQREKEIRGPVQIAEVAQDFADFLSAFLSLAPALYFTQHLSAWRDRDKAERTGKAVFRVGSADCGDECTGQPRTLSRSRLVSRHSRAHALSGALLLRLDLPHGHPPAPRRQHALWRQARQAN